MTIFSSSLSSKGVMEGHSNKVNALVVFKQYNKFA